MAKSSSPNPDPNLLIFPPKQGIKIKVSVKKIALIGIASIVGLLLLCAIGWLFYINTQFSTYQDGQNKFSIKYPNAWKVIVSPRKNVAVVFLRPKDTALDPVQESFNVTIQPMPVGIFTLKPFSAAIKGQMTGVFGKSIHIVEEKSLHWGWREGREMVIEAPVPDHLIMVNAWLIRSDQACILTFLGDMGKYATDSLLVDEMIHSLQLQ